MKIFFKGSEGDSSLAGGQTIQYPEMPTASTDLAGKIVQYVGTTNTNYTNGYFYKCVLQAGAYKWEPKIVQTGGGGGGDVPIATTETPGIVKPDGTTITVDNDGTIHSIGGGSADFPAGGTTGQALVKASDEDNDVEWGDMPNVPIEKITVNGTEQAISNKTVAITVITETVNNLVNYYTKTETYTREQVHQIISAASFGGFEVVATLPTTDISTRTIYLVPKSTAETGNVYDEFIYVNNSWENIGDTEIDLTVYQTKNLVTPITVGIQQYTTVETAISAINSAFANYLKTADFNTAIANYYTKTQVDAVTGDLTDLETTDKSSLVGAINELNTAVRPRTEIEISTVNDFRSAGQGAFAFITTVAVTITLADANTVTIPANTQGFFDVGETDTDTNDYTGVIQYITGGREKTIYFNSTAFTLPITDSVRIDDTTPSASTVFSSRKTDTLIKTPMTGASQYVDGTIGAVPQPLSGDDQKALFGDGTYHTIYTSASGSTIIVKTTETSLYGRTVTLSMGTQSLTATIGTTGEATFTNVSFYGTVNVVADDGNGNYARGSANLTYFGTYVVSLTMNFATLNFISDNAALVGKNLDLKIGNKTITTFQLSLVAGTTDTYMGTVYVDRLATYKVDTMTDVGRVRGTVVADTYTTYNVTVNTGEIYAFKINHNDSNPATCVTPYENEYGCDNLNFTPAHMDYTKNTFDYGSWTGQEFFFPKPCMLKYDGTVDYYLDPNDYSLRADGTPSDVADMSYVGNVMVEFPTVYFKRWQEGNYSYCIISNKQLDADFHAWAHHDVNGDVLPYIYISAYDGVYDGTRMRSISGCGYNATLSSGNVICQTTRQQEINFAQANNLTGYTGEGWYLRHKADWDMVNDLLILIGMSTDTQTTFGRGNDSRGSNGCIGTGTMDNKGLFWGSNDGTSGVKVFGIENWWANIFKSCAGWFNDKGTQKVKYTYGTEDGSTEEGFNTDASGYISIAGATPSNGGGSTYGYGYITAWQYGDYGILPYGIISGASNKYLCDYLWFNNAAVCFALIGAASNNYGVRSGAFSSDLEFDTNERSWEFGAAFSYKGIVT